jgi:hypothetical protein
MEWLLVIIIGYLVYRWWKNTDQKMFKAKYLSGKIDKPYITREVRMDNILDKISKKGIESLTSKEKDFLDNQKRF